MNEHAADAAWIDARVLEPADARAYLDAPITEAERENVLALVGWFRRRYPSPLERLTYVREAYARWQRTLGVAGRPHVPTCADEPGLQNKTRPTSGLSDAPVRLRPDRRAPGRGPRETQS